MVLLETAQGVTVDEIRSTRGAELVVESRLRWIFLIADLLNQQSRISTWPRCSLCFWLSSAPSTFLANLFVEST